MTLKDLSKILFSTRDNIQHAILYSVYTNTVIEDGCSIEYLVKNYGEFVVRHIEASGDKLVVTVG